MLYLSASVYAQTKTNPTVYHSAQCMSRGYRQFIKWHINLPFPLRMVYIIRVKQTETLNDTQRPNHNPQSMRQW